MCGIVGYIGDRNVPSILLVGLERLSYRGYDSSGIAILDQNELSYWKKTGKLHALSDELSKLTITGNIGIGHTRWATHGIPSEENAHPHLGPKMTVAVVHNGIIENYLAIKDKLQKQGFMFRSETDTEVVSHLIEYFLKDSLEDAVKKTIQELTGAFALAIISETEPNKMIVCRKGSPLIIGLGKDENFVASDINAIIPHTKDMIHLDDNEMAIIEKNKITIKSFDGEVLNKEVQHVSWDPVAAEKSGYEHFMLKEIHEQPIVVRNIMSKLIVDGKFNFKHLKLSRQELNNVNRFIIQACGTSWHAGLVMKYLLEKYARVITDVDISSEFRYRHKVNGINEIVIALSQSGETADTLACLREAKSKFYKVLCFVNAKNSSMDREADAVVYTYAGQEVGVASTKNFIAQLVTTYLFTLYLSQIRWTLTEEEVKTKLDELKKIPDYIEKILSEAESIKKIALKYFKSGSYLFIGRGVNYPSALEGALKLKEISYIHATGYPAGELKHGPLALIDENMPIVCLAPNAETYEKMISNIEEVRARKGKTIVIATEGNSAIKHVADEVIYIPEVSEDLTPILAAIPMQLLAYYTAINLGCDVDQPRNLAKSVTVE